MNILNKSKKIFLILSFIGITVLIAFFLYKVFFQTPVTTTPNNEELVNQIGGLPNAATGTGQIINISGDGIPDSNDILNPKNNGEPSTDDVSDLALGGITKTDSLTDDSTLKPTLSSNGDVQYYNQDDGFFYYLNNDGEKIKMSDRVFHQVQDVIWSPDKNKAVLEYPDKTKIVYDFKTEKQITLPKHWESFSFSPQSNEIITKSIGLDPDNRFLTVASLDNSQAKNIEEIGLNADKVQVSWSPNNQIVATYTKGLDFDRQEVFFVGLNGENFKSTTVEGRGLVYEWSTSGDRLLYSVYNNNSDLKPKLWIVDAEGDEISNNRRSLGLNTWADKCTFSTNTEIYCAVPRELERGSGMFREVADQTADDVYKINLATGETSLVAIPDIDFNAINLMVNNNEELIFSDKNSGAIYKINLR